MIITTFPPDATSIRISGSLINPGAYFIGASQYVPAPPGAPSSSFWHEAVYVGSGYYSPPQAYPLELFVTETNTGLYYPPSPTLPESIHIYWRGLIALHETPFTKIVNIDPDDWTDHGGTTLYLNLLGGASDCLNPHDDRMEPITLPRIKITSIETSPGGGTTRPRINNLTNSTSTQKGNLNRGLLHASQTSSYSQ